MFCLSAITDVRHYLVIMEGLGVQVQNSLKKAVTVKQYGLQGSARGINAI